MIGLRAYSKGNTRWNTTGGTGSSADYKGTKTIYDPCPRGWRMPWGANFSGFKRDEMSPFTWQKSSETTTSGSVYNKTNAFFPGTGNRHVSAGKLMMSGSYVAMWSGAGHKQEPTLHNGYCLSLHASYISPGANCSRAYGYPVRPVQE